MDLDFEARRYLHQLDTLKRPPDIVNSDEIFDKSHDQPSSSSTSKPSNDFLQKLQEINISHQKQVTNSQLVNKLTPSIGLNIAVNNKTMLKLGEQSPAAAQISKDEIDKLRRSVLQATRPKNPWADRQSPVNYSDQPTKNSKPSLRSPLNVETVSGDDTIFDARRAQPSTHSLSPGSPLSNSTPSSSSSTAGATKWQSSIKLDGQIETFHARPAAVASKNVNTSSYQARESHPRTTTVKTYYHGGVPKPKLSAKEQSESKTNGHRQYQSIYAKVSPQTTPLQNGAAQPQSKNFLKRDAKNQAVPSWRQPAKPITSTEVVRSVPKLSPTTSDLKILEELEAESRKRIETLTFSKDAQILPVVGQKIIGNCGKCKQEVMDNNNVTYALEQVYHDKCFVCDACHLPLKGTRFYKINDKNYCENDYSTHEPKTICVVCNRPIFEAVLQALGKAYHPQCFRCHKCDHCLDGVPFAADAAGKVYCMKDYESTLSPTCASCHRPIKPANDFGQIIRVFAMNKEYHIECFICEGCGAQLTNEKDRQCFPLNNHLLCKNCHIHWKKYGGLDQPITDL